MPKFAFDVQNVRILVDAADKDDAIDNPSEISGYVDSNLGFCIRHVGQNFTELRTCCVCGCTDDDACHPRRCSWLSNNLCSTDDKPHQNIRVMQGLL
jgi:hypothetical protein